MTAIQTIQNLPAWRRWLIIILALLTVAMMVFIFVRSSKDDTESARESGDVIEKLKPVAEKIVSKTKILDDKESFNLFSNFDFYVRKTAHFTMYMVLSALSSSLMYALPKAILPFRRHSVLYSLAFTILYAASDEFHQYFVPGRSMELRDVMIDSSGALLGAVAVMAVYAIIKLRRKASKRG